MGLDLVEIQNNTKYCFLVCEGCVCDLIQKNCKTACGNAVKSAVATA